MLGKKRRHKQRGGADERERHAVDGVEVEPTRGGKRSKNHKSAGKKRAEYVSSNHGLARHRGKLHGKRAYRHERDGLHRHRFARDDLACMGSLGHRKRHKRAMRPAQGHNGQHAGEHGDPCRVEPHEHPAYQLAHKDGRRMVHGHAHGVERPEELAPQQDEKRQAAAGKNEAYIFERCKTRRRGHAHRGWKKARCHKQNRAERH